MLIPDLSLYFVRYFLLSEEIFCFRLVCKYVLVDSSVTINWIIGALYF